jgi:acyl-CoA thioester hydrolase
MMTSGFDQFIFHYQVVETDLDTFGHVNNARYLSIFELARWQFITERGFGIDRIQQGQKGPVVLGIDIKFKRELKNRDRITIKSQTISIADKIMVLQQQMIKEDGSVSCEANFTVGYFDMRERKLIKPDQDWLNAIGVQARD